MSGSKKTTRNWGCGIVIARVVLCGGSDGGEGEREDEDLLFGITQSRR